MLNNTNNMSLLDTNSNLLTTRSSIAKNSFAKSSHRICFSPSRTTLHTSTSSVLVSPSNNKFNKKYDEILLQVSKYDESRNKSKQIKPYISLKNPSNYSQLSKLKNEISIKKIKPLTDYLFTRDKIPLNLVSPRERHISSYTHRGYNDQSLKRLSSDKNLLLSSKTFSDFCDDHKITLHSARRKPYYSKERQESKDKIKQMKTSIQKSLNMFRK